MSVALIPSVSLPSLSLRKQQCVEPLLNISNAQQRLATIVEAARRRAPLADALRAEAHRVPGCMVRTWFVAEVRDGRCYFAADSDAAMLKACLGLLCDVYSGQTVEEVAADSGTLLQDLGVLHQLAENRQRTVAKVAQQLIAFAEQNLPQQAAA